MRPTKKMLDRFKQALVEWDRTPYMAGQCVPGLKGGTDCLRFSDAILQRFYGLNLEPLPREAQDAALHNPEVVKKIARLVIERFDFVTIREERFQPGDWLCVRPKVPGEKLTLEQMVEIRPHHCIVVGPDGRRCWHAVPKANVCWTGIGGVLAAFDIIKIWRSRKGYDEA